MRKINLDDGQVAVLCACYYSGIISGQRTTLIVDSPSVVAKTFLLDVTCCLMHLQSNGGRSLLLFTI